MAASSQLELVQALQLACSQNPDELKLGEKRLESWKTEGGYYSGLAVSIREALTTAVGAMMIRTVCILICVTRLFLETRLLMLW